MVKKLSSLVVTMQMCKPPNGHHVHDDVKLAKATQMEEILLMIGSIIALYGGQLALHTQSVSANSNPNNLMHLFFFRVIFSEFVFYSLKRSPPFRSRFAMERWVS